MILLAKGPIFEVVADDGFATCTVVNRGDVSAEEGARCAGEMRNVLLNQVAVRGSPYRGLVFDVRRGPPVFGPKTRDSLGELFDVAEKAGKRIAVCVSSASAVQKLQFAGLCRDHAPIQGRVFEGDGAIAWARGDT